jgi:hypothetical protein
LGTVVLAVRLELMAQILCLALLHQLEVVLETIQLLAVLADQVVVQA